MADSGEASSLELVEPRPTLRPKLQLFLSADVVGSTAYKQRSEPDSGDGDNWFLMVSSFYSQAGAILRNQWGWYDSTLRDESQAGMLGPSPMLWKTIGDEVLFVKEVENPSQAVMTLHVWMATLKELRKVLQKFHPALDVKATAWLADFPIRNREIILGVAASEQEDDLDWTNDQLMQEIAAGTSKLICDYIGPSIDTGFRLGGASTPRQLAVSVELAHMLSYEECQPRTKYTIGPAQILAFQFRYDGRHPLKGVLNGASYPQIWIDTAPDGSLNKAEDALLLRSKPTCQDIHAFTTAFIEEHASKFCTGLSFSLPQLPEAYQAHCDAISEQIRERELKFRKIDGTRAARLVSVSSPEADPAAAQLDVSLRLVGEPDEASVNAG